ncbi:PREDICTED: zinc finger protein 62-like [Dinoponera quadriceps]|uniref:Zinc finger protein 62-like n=1 Tax=Dinoponera quadriceps TaxID=609295 RepID=A0A6P3X495_DINQU|nr:PREDICTED: zinc finger protein 62-like [Dinoponera quadriceps]
MPNDEVASTAEPRREATNGDIGYTASSSSPPRLDFEFKECKTEPGSASEDLSEFDRFSPNLDGTLDIPVLEPVVLLEKCDKIWKTLQLIKTMQRTSPITTSDEGEGDEGEREEVEEDEKVASSPNKTEQTLSIKSAHKSTNDSKTPFQFSVQKTRRLYPCVTCGKQYLEKRSLRKHALRIHGIIIPVKFRRTRKPRITDLLDLNKNNGTTLFNKGNGNSEKLDNNRPLYGRTTIFNDLKSQNVSSLNSSNDQSENVSAFTSEKGQYSTCALCRQKVKCLKKHLINYHKIGCSANMLKQLETSLVVESGSSSSSSSSSGKPTLKDILSGKPPEALSVNRSMQGKSHTTDSENKSHVTSQVPQKRKYTLSYVSTKKRFKLNNGRFVSLQNASKFAQVQSTSKFTPKFAQVRVKYLSKNKYKCDICLGAYSSPNCLAKHKRIHASRGETKDNIHKFECKYFNSPLSKRYQDIMSSVKPTDTAAKDVNDGLNENREPDDPKMSSQNQRTSKNGRAATHDADKEDTTCICGRSFRTSHILCAHRDNCKLYNQEDKAAQHSTRDEYSSDRDSGIGINVITIKKRNNSYEIVGKDGEEDKQTDHGADGALSSNMSQDAVENASDANAEQRQANINETSNYSRNHSILKLKDADEDVIIDIENDIQLLSRRKGKQTTVRRDNKSGSRTRQNDDGGDGKEDNTLESVPTLKEICQKVLKKNSTLQKQEEDATTRPEKKRNLRSVSTSHLKMEEDYVDPEVSMAMNLDPMTCAYCNKHFNTMNTYNKHQCTVEEGRQFDEYSLNLLCFCCNETLDSCSQFDEHMKNEHYDRAYHCYLCPEKFSSRKLRNKHTNTQHDTSCKFCHMDIPLWILNLHEAYHLGVGYPCHKCKKAYANRRNLSYHNTTIHKSGVDNMIFCNLCLRSVKLKSFRSHMSAHDLNKCHFCGKEFIDRIGIEYHTRIHHGGTFSKLKCADCGARFWTKRQLEQHKKTGRCGTIKRMREESNKTKSADYC